MTIHVKIVTVFLISNFLLNLKFERLFATLRVSRRAYRFGDI